MGEIEGLVAEVGLLSTKLVTARKEEITIPNAVMIGEATVNYSRLPTRTAPSWRSRSPSATTPLAPGASALLCPAADRTEAVRRRPRVVQRSLGDFYVEYTLVTHVDQPWQRPAILSELHANIRTPFNEYGVQIMSPHFENQPHAPVVVPKDKRREAPANSDE